jgi:WD40 repeat protein
MFLPFGIRDAIYEFVPFFNITDTSLVLGVDQGDIEILVQLRDGHLASGCTTGVISIWDISKFGRGRLAKCIDRCVGHHERVLALFELFDGRLMSGSSDQTIRVWENSMENNVSRSCVRILRNNFSYIFSLLQLFDGLVVCGSGRAPLINGFDDANKSIQVWDVTSSPGSYKCIQLLRGHEESDPYCNC